jgi:DNA-directed RNA polymerase II subunit RPB9
MKFCNSCNNMLIPVEDKETKKLKFKCNFCNHTEAVEENDQNQNTVYINEIQLSHYRKAIDPSIINDPTYSRTKAVECSQCGHNEAIHFHDFTQESAGMLLIFVCCNENCTYSWEEK